MGKSSSVGAGLAGGAAGLAASNNPSLFFGKEGGQTGTTTGLSGQQENLLNATLQQLLGGQLGQTDISQSPGYQQAVSSLGQFLQPDQEGLQRQFQSQFVDPAMQTFQQQVIPGIEQRYSEAGAGRSSALNQSLAQAGQNLQTQLGSQLAGLIDQQQGRQLQAAGALGQLSNMPAQNAMQLLQLGLQPSRTPIISQGEGGILPGLLSAGGTIAGAYFGGPAGAAAGGQAGQAAGNAFSRGAR